MRRPTKQKHIFAPCVAPVLKRRQNNKPATKEIFVGTLLTLISPIIFQD